jgi:hypothetical protein
LCSKDCPEGWVAWGNLSKRTALKMELILNLLWLALVLPAYWLWRRELDCARSGRSFRSLHSVLVLGCILILLFPVISATDDLHFIRPEMEESSPSKRALKQIASDKASTWMFAHVPDLIQATATHSLAPADHICGQVFRVAVRCFSTLFFSTQPGRAPPRSLLA